MSLANSFAFPRPAVFTEVHGLASVELDGMTLRQYYAGLALQGLLASDVHASHESFASAAVKLADTLLAKLEEVQ